jgi:leucine dehydrogenase
MSVFTNKHFDDHEHVAFHHDKASGLKAIVAIHNTARGPAYGGCRMWNYTSEEEALADALRLSRGMTYKSALADLDFGGGKAVIIGDPARDKSEPLWLAYGRFIDSLGGRYVTAEDVGTRPADLEIARRATRHVVGIAEGGAGDPSPATAYGVFTGIRAAIAERLQREDMAGLRVAVQGLGVDVFAPCALGSVVNDGTVGDIRARIVAGSANNQLAEPRHGEALRERGILYAPDYAINAGGVIWISHEGPQFDAEGARAHVARIGDTLSEIFARARREDIAPETAADRIAEQRFRRPEDIAA